MEVGSPFLLLDGLPTDEAAELLGAGVLSLPAQAVAQVVSKLQLTIFQLSLPLILGEAV